MKKVQFINRYEKLYSILVDVTKVIKNFHILAHADLMQTTEASYPFKKSEVRAYNDNKGNTEVIIENPYESKILDSYWV